MSLNMWMAFAANYDWSERDFLTIQRLTPAPSWRSYVCFIETAGFELGSSEKKSDKVTTTPPDLHPFPRDKILCFVNSGLAVNKSLNQPICISNDGISVTGLGDFWKFFVSRLLLKWAQMYSDILRLFENITFQAKSVVATFGLLLISTTGHTGRNLSIDAQKILE